MKRFLSAAAALLIALASDGHAIVIVGSDLPIERDVLSGREAWAAVPDCILASRKPAAQRVFGSYNGVLQKLGIAFRYRRWLRPGSPFM